MSRVALEVTMGFSLLLLSVLVYTRLTTVDPYLWLTFGSCRAANAIALLHLLATLSFWSSVSRLAKRPGRVLVSGMVGLVAALAFSELTGIDLGDLLRLYVGGHAVWLLIVLTVFMLPLLRATSDGDRPQSWKWWGFLGGVSFCGGLVLYATPIGKSTGGVLAEVMLILTLPTLSLICAALRYSGRHELPLRGLAALGAMIGAAVATIC